MKSAKKRLTRLITFPCFFMVSLLISNCSNNYRQFSYFNMLDDKKRTHGNKQAAEKFWTSVRPVSTLSDSHYRLGLHYQRNGEYDKAIGEFAKALQNDSTYCKAYNGIAMSYDALRQCEPAHASYDLALKCATGQAYIYNNYACSSLLCGYFAKGVDLLRRAEQLAENETRIKNNLRIAQEIVIHEKISDYIPMKQLFSQVVESDSVSSLPEEGLLTHPVSKISANTRHTISDESTGKCKIQPDNKPATSAARETLGLPLSPSISNSAVQVKLIAEKSKQDALPGPSLLSRNSTAAIEVSNGNGTTGMAGRSADFLRGHGFSVRSITNAKHFRFEESVIFYKEEYLHVAKELAAIIPGAQNLEKVDTMAKASIGVRVLLGRDLVSMQFPERLAEIAGPSSQKHKAENLLTSTVTVFNNLVHY